MKLKVIKIKIQRNYTIPRVNKDLDLKYNIENHIIKICTVNLNMKWYNIENRLLEIIG